MTVECLKNALALIENYFGRPLSTDERTARSQIYAAALKDIPDDVAAAALTKALTVCRYQNQLLVDWCAEIRKLQSAGQPTANDLWTQAIVAARKIERNQYYATHGGLVTATGKLTAEYFRAENRSIFGALPAAVREWAGSPAGLVDALDRSNADLLQYAGTPYHLLDRDPMGDDLESVMLEQTDIGSWVTETQTAIEDADALNVDQAYRLTLLELGITDDTDAS